MRNIGTENLQVDTSSSKVQLSLAKHVNLMQQIFLVILIKKSKMWRPKVVRLDKTRVKSLERWPEDGCVGEMSSLRRGALESLLKARNIAKEDTRCRNLWLLQDFNLRNDLSNQLRAAFYVSTVPPITTGHFRFHLVLQQHIVQIKLCFSTGWPQKHIPGEHKSNYVKWGNQCHNSLQNDVSFDFWSSLPHIIGNYTWK